MVQGEGHHLEDSKFGLARTSNILESHTLSVEHRLHLTRTGRLSPSFPGPSLWNATRGRAVFVKSLGACDWRAPAPIRNIGTMATKRSSADHPSLWHWAFHAHCTTSVRSSRSGPRAPAARRGVLSKLCAPLCHRRSRRDSWTATSNREQGEANRVH
jgi:hypothetical protein